MADRIAEDFASIAAGAARVRAEREAMAAGTRRGGAAEARGAEAASPKAEDGHWAAVRAYYASLGPFGASGPAGGGGGG